MDEMTWRMRMLTASVSSAATGICHGAECMSWVAGSTPLRISLWTERTQMPSRVAASSALIVSARGHTHDAQIKERRDG